MGPRCLPTWALGRVGLLLCYVGVSHVSSSYMLLDF